MSDTMKLSELLEHSVSGITSMAYDYGEADCDYTQERLLKQAKALRAIAPALVELVAATDVREQHTEADCVNDVHRLNSAAATLSEVMQKAGVTCD